MPEAVEDVRYYIAIEGGYAIIDGEHCGFQEGKTTVEKGHPLLKMCPASFRPFEPTYAAPRKRGTRTAA